jgi:hypothetical protein
MASILAKREESINMAHVSSVKIDTRMILSDVLIETSGGADPIRCHGHRKGDALEMKQLIEDIAKALVDIPEEVVVNVVEGERKRV